MPETLAGHRGGAQKGNKTPEATKDKTTDGTDTRRARPEGSKTREEKQAHTGTEASTRQKTTPLFPRTFSLDGSWDGGPRS